MKVLITGGGGFVGSHLAEAELRNGNEVTCLDISPPDKVEHLLGNRLFRYVQEDMMAVDSELKYLVEWCDIVYHLAAIADPEVYCNNPMKVLRIDMEGTQLIIKLAWQMHKKLVFSSTSEVYGKNPKVPWKEDDDRLLGTTTTNRWCYSSSKAVGEHYCYAYGMDGLKFAILRFFNFYGPRLDFIGTGRVMTCFLDKFLKGEDVEVCAPGTQTRCFTYISDGIDAVMEIAHSKEAEGKTFNIGTTVETDMITLASIMKRIGGFRSNIKVIPVEKKYGKSYDDIPRRIPDCSRLKSLFDWYPKIDLERGIEETIKYYKEQYANSYNAA